MIKSSTLKKQKSNHQSGETSISPKASAVLVVRQCLGVDVSKEELKVCFKEEDSEKNTRIKGQTTFTNSPAGWVLVKKYCERFRKLDVPFLVVMEATGVYHESLAYFLKGIEVPLSVVLPNKSKYFAKGLGIKTKNDKVDAQTLAQMGLNQKLTLWKGLDPTMLKIKRVLREKEALQKQNVMLKNQNHARKFAFSPDVKSEQRTVKHIEFIDDQIKEIDTQVSELLNSDAELKAKIKKVCTIKGVGLTTALAVIAETNAFELFQNKAQVVSYAGYDVVQCESGTSVHKKTRISKKGNAHIRRALYFGAMSAAEHDEKMKNKCDRITAKNPNVRMIGLVAVQRSLLVLIYTLFKNNTEFDPNYEKNKKELIEQKNRQTLLESLPKPA